MTLRSFSRSTLSAVSIAGLILSAPSLALAQPAGDPVADLLRRAPPSQPQDRWDPAWDEPARPVEAGGSVASEDDPEVSITQRLNAGVLEADQAIVARNAEAEARWRAEVAATEEIAVTEQTAYQRALAEHQRMVMQQHADHDARMRAWQAQADACRRGVRQACVAWHRER